MKHLRLFIASSYDLIDEVEKIAKHIEGKGCIITRYWWKLDDLKKEAARADGDKVFLNNLMNATFFANITAIERADIVIVVCHPTEYHNFVGADVEIGMATMLGKPILSIGKLIPSAMHSGVIKAKSISELDLFIERFMP